MVDCSSRWLSRSIRQGTPIFATPSSSPAKVQPSYTEVTTLPSARRTTPPDACSALSMSRPTTAMSQGASEEEDEKRFFSVLMPGDQMVSIDNVTWPIHRR